MKPGRSPTGRVVAKRLAMPIAADASPPPGRITWARRSSSIREMSDRKVATLARTQPARSTTEARSTTPGSGVPSAAESRGTTRSIASR